MTKLIPRPYQLEARDKIIAAWDSGLDSVYIKAATGAGKTIIAGLVCDAIMKQNPDARIMFVSHTNELVQQPVDKLNQFFPHLGPFGFIRGGANGKRFVNKKIVSAGYQTLYRRDYAYVKAMIEHGGITHVIDDECHHAVSNKRMGIHKTIRELSGTHKILGLSATPTRSDQEPLSNLFQKCVAEVSISYLVALGYLNDFDVKRVDLPADFSEIKRSGSGEFRDYSAEAVSSVLDVDNVFEVAYEQWRKHASHMATLCFVPKVDMAMHICEYFSRNGVKCAVVVGDKKKTGMYVNGKFVTKRRHLLIKYFNERKLDVMFNCMALTEGFDAPITGCIMILRPTSSESLATQMVGRGLRTHPDKIDNTLILSFVPLSFKGLKDGKELKAGVEKKKATDENLMADEIEEMENKEFKFGVNVDPNDVVIRSINFLKGSSYAWLTHSNGLSVMGTGGNARHRIPYRSGVAILLNSREAVKGTKKYLNGTHKEFANKEDERYAVMAFNYNMKGHSSVTPIAVTRDFETAKRRAERYADHVKGVGNFKKDSRWRENEKASKSMEDKLRNWGIELKGVDRPVDRGSKLIYWMCAYKTFLE